MGTSELHYSIAPEKLWQSINPWSFHNQGAQFGLINIDLGTTPRPEVEQAVLEEVGARRRRPGRRADTVSRRNG